MRPGDLNGLELMLVAIARALVLVEPKILVIDEPVIGVELIERDRILTLLRRFADEGIAVLTSTGDSTGLSGADRAILLSKGELHGEPATPQLAPVVHLPGVERRRSA
jgi:ABC-type multidrug transport system ATPase subunit